MYRVFRLAATASLCSVVFLTACSLNSEDPRISFCREVAADLTQTQKDSWAQAGTRMVRPEYAAVTVKGDGEVTCYYAYDAQEEGAMEHANPLLAYATLPYRIDANGRSLTGKPLLEVVKRQQVAGLKSGIEQVQSAVDLAAEQAKEQFERAGEGIKRAVDAQSQ